MDPLAYTELRTFSAYACFVQELVDRGAVLIDFFLDVFAFAGVVDLVR